MLGSFAGMLVSVSAHATEERPIFPDKRNTKRRRRRVVGKYGAWTRRYPAAFRMGAQLVVHPAIYAVMQHQHRANTAVL